MTDHNNEAPAKLITSAEVEQMRDLIKRADGRLILMEQSPGNNYHWTKRVTDAKRDEWLEILDLAAMAARIRER